MGYVLIEFILEWVNEDRLPRDELKVRGWIAVAGAACVLAVATALVITATH